MSIKKAQEAVDAALLAVIRALESTGYNDLESLDCIFDEQDPNEIELRDELENYLESLKDATDRLLYLRKPITHEGAITQAENGRLQVDGVQLTSGRRIELLLYDFINEREEWILTRIEHNGNNYYFVNHKSLLLEDIRKARLRD
jgi:hypothetical protein